VRWYLRYALSYRDVEELLRERGIFVDHTTVCRWVQRYAPELDKRCRPHLNSTNNSYRVDEMYIKIKKQWHYLYRAVDSQGQTLDFLLSPTRDAEAAERFFRQVLQASHTRIPRVITVDKNAAYPLAFEALQQEGILPETCQLRPCKYLNNVLVSATATQGTCSGTDPVVSTLGTLTEGGGAAVMIVGRPLAPGELSNTATVSGDAPDPDSSNNTATAVTLVVEPPSPSPTLPTRTCP
jgi:transposase-like protein